MASESAVERAEALANRVRLAAAEGGSGGDGSLVAEAVSGLGAGEANEMLRETERLVPGWSGGRAFTQADGSVVVVSGAELSDADFLAEELAIAAVGLSESDRRAAGERLAAAGVASSGAAEVGAESAARLVAALKLRDAGEIDAARLADGFAIALECLKALDKLAWGQLRSLSPNSSVRRRGDLNVLLGLYVAGRKRETAETVGEEFAKFQRLAASLMASSGAAGDVAFRRVSTLNPMHIEGLAEKEKSAMETQEAACWRKFRDLAGQLDESTVKGETERAIASIVEGLMTS